MDLPGLYGAAARRYGTRWLLRLPERDWLLTAGDAADLMSADPEIALAGRASAALEPIGGPNSVVVLDGAAHRQARRTLLPPFTEIGCERMCPRRATDRRDGLAVAGRRTDDDPTHAGYLCSTDVHDRRLSAVPRESHKQRLLEGALECLRTKGYAKTTARDIAAAANANLGSIGYHYGSTDALLTAALVEGFRAWTARISATVAEIEADSPAERLRRSWETILAELGSEEGLLRAFLEALAPAARSPELRAELASFYRETREDLGAVVAESLGDAPESIAAARVIASLLIAFSDGLQLQWFLEPAETPNAQQIGAAAQAAVIALGSEFA
ncbi:MAG: TetR family transcriptional regulator C-terminal domain-containing protein [Thermoleophilaceae bacterium]